MKIRPRFGLLLGLAAAMALWLLTPAGAQALTLGPSNPALGTLIFSSGSGTAVNSAAPPGVQLTAPDAGVLTRWRVGTTGTVRLRILRRSGMTNNYSGIATGPTVTGTSPSTIQTVATRMPIAAGDSIAIDVVSGSFSGSSASGWTLNNTSPAFIPDGGAPQATTAAPGFVLGLNADFELDADGDGFGDESQDLCPGTAGPDRGCPLGMLDPKIVQVVQVSSPAGGPAIVDLSKVRLSKDRKTLSFGVSCPAQRVKRCRGKASAKTARKVSLARSSAKKAVLKLGSASFDIPAGQVKTVKVKVSSKARKTLKTLKKIRLKLIVTESSSGTKTL